MDYIYNNLNLWIGNMEEIDNDYKPKPGYIRASSISGFDFCPRKYKYTKIDGIKAYSGPKAQKGKDFHKAMEDYFKGKQLTNLNKQIKQWVEWCIELEEMRKKQVDYLPPHSIELRIINDDIKLSGTIDRVDWYEKDKSVNIIDYKTSNNFKEREVKAQMATYGMLFQLHTNLEVKNLIAIYPALQDFFIMKFNKQSLKMAVSRIGKIRYAEKNNYFPKKCSVTKWHYCKICDFKEVNRMINYIR